MTVPTMAGWNLALRFGIELAALASLAVAAWKLSSGPVKWVGVVVVPVAAAAIWGVFNVLNDPSRSGEAPIEVGGLTRLVIELLILGGGAAAVALVAHRGLGLAFAVLILGHYAASWSRVEWLLSA